MSIVSTAFRLVFAREFSEHDALEARDRGYLSHVLVEIDGQHLYPVVFYDPVRLQQDLETSAKHGRAFVADPGMIVLPEITLESMHDAVRQLCQEGLFDFMAPLAPGSLNNGECYSWPPGYGR